MRNNTTLRSIDDECSRIGHHRIITKEYWFLNLLTRRILYNHIYTQFTRVGLILFLGSKCIFDIYAFPVNRIDFSTIDIELDFFLIATIVFLLQLRINRSNREEVFQNFSNSLIHKPLERIQLNFTKIR